MLSLFVCIQYIGIVVLLVEILYVINQKSSRLQVIMLVLLIATLVNFAGYLFEIQATTKEMALQAVKIIYLGKPYIVLGMFLFAMKYYRVELSKRLKRALCVIHIGISMLVLTCSHHNLFYSSIDFVEDKYFPHLVLGHGIIYNIYTCGIFLYLIIMLVIGVKRYRNAKTINERRQIGLLIVIPCVSVTGLVLFFSGVTRGYDSTLPAYLIITVLLLISMVRYNLLDTVALAKENVIDEFADGLVVLDDNNKMIYANSQVIEVYPEFATDNYEDVLEGIERLSESGEKLFLNQKVYTIYKKDIEKDHIIYGKMLVISDVTENYNYTIQLEKQTAIAKQANKAKSEFLAKMSHEIRTPINAVLGMNEMILRESREAETRKYAMDIKTAANTLLSIINDILDSSKIESGKLEIIPVIYELDSLLNDIVNMIYLKAKDKNLDFEVIVDEKLPNRQYGDDVRLRQILVNLLNNAIKYTQKGKVTLKATGVFRDKKIVMHYEIKDTGIGIKEEDMPKLYEAFERIEEKRNHNIEGTGLGMSIVVELLRLMDSRLHVESRYGEGSSFSFDLEQDIIDSEPIGDFETRSKRLYEEPTDEALFIAPKAKILVVDDNQINRKVFSSLLKRTQVQVADAESGAQCLEQVQKERFDLIFMDHMMPDMDGVETLTRMRQLPDYKCRNVPVIILTANAVTGAKEYYLNKGFDDFLSKPVTGTGLEKMILKYLPKELWSETEKETAAAALKEPEKKIMVNTGIPEMEGFDLSYARRFIPDDKLLLQTMQQVAQSMKDNEKQLGEFLQKGDLENYQILVHALKSSTAMIGAIPLSELAKQLEGTAARRDMDEVQKLHPVLMEEMGKYWSRMQVLF